MKKAKKNYISKAWYENLLSQLNELKKVELPEILERLSEAKQLWDLSENFEYKSALEEKDLANSKIAELEKLIANSEIIEESDKKEKWVIDYWAIVTLKLETGKEYKVEMVWSWEVSIWDDVMKISPQSPIWTAIKWKKAKDKVIMRIDNDRQKVEILSVVYK